MLVRLAVVAMLLAMAPARAEVDDADIQRIWGGSLASGVATPWRSHAGGPLFVYVIAGRVAVERQDGSSRTVGAGETAQTPAGAAMRVVGRAQGPNMVMIFRHEGPTIRCPWCPQ